MVAFFGNVKRLAHLAGENVSGDRALAEIAGLATAAKWLCRICWILSAASFAVQAVLVGQAASSLFAAGASIRMTAGGNLLLSADGISPLLLAGVGEGTAFGGFASSLIAAILLFLGDRFFAHVAQTRRPFERARARELKRIAVALISLSVLPGVTGLLLNVVTMVAVGHLPSAAVTLLDTRMLLAGIILLAFGYIFDYGCALQEHAKA